MLIPLAFLKYAPYFERLVNCDLYWIADDGLAYRPVGGWPREYAYQ